MINEALKYHSAEDYFMTALQWQAMIFNYQMQSIEQTINFWGGVYE